MPLGIAFCCACTAAAACLIRDDDDSDFCSMTSDMLRFFKIGFFFDCDSMNELDLNKPADELVCASGTDDADEKAFLPGSRGP